MQNVTIHHSIPSNPDPSALVIKGHNIDGHLYRWRAGDCLSIIAVRYMRPSSDWKILYELNSELYYRRRNIIMEGDLIKIPGDWLPLKSNSYDNTVVEMRNQDLQRESFLLKMFGRLQNEKEQNND